jgi:hypothetical protein
LLKRSVSSVQGRRKSVTRLRLRRQKKQLNVRQLKKPKNIIATLRKVSNYLIRASVRL